jgi:hypothetical protein
MLLSWMFCACSTPEDQVRAAMERVESAAVHGDAETLYLLHRDSVDGGPFCSETFGKAWRGAGRATPETCEEARRVRTAPAAGSEEAQLLALTIDFRCSHPEGSCEDLARTAFTQRVKGAPGTLDSMEVNHVELRDRGKSASVHVTLYHSKGDKTRAVFTLEQMGTRWLLTSSPF